MRQNPPEFIDIALYWNDEGLITLDDGSRIHPMVDYGEPSCQSCGCWSISTEFGEFKSGDTEGNEWLANQRWNYSGFEKAHIVAHEYGGSDTDPSNFLILCRTCHYDFDNEVYICDKNEIDDVYYWLKDREKNVLNRKIKYCKRFEKDKNIPEFSNKFSISKLLVGGNLSKDLDRFEEYLSEDELKGVEEHLKKAKVKPGAKRLERSLKFFLETSFIVMQKIFNRDEFDFLDEEETWWPSSEKLIRLLNLRKSLKDKDCGIKHSEGIYS